MVGGSWPWESVGVADIISKVFFSFILLGKSYPCEVSLSSGGGSHTTRLGTELCKVRLGGTTHKLLQHLAHWPTNHPKTPEMQWNTIKKNIKNRRTYLEICHQIIDHHHTSIVHSHLSYLQLRHAHPRLISPELLDTGLARKHTLRLFLPNHHPRSLAKIHYVYIT